MLRYLHVTPVIIKGNSVYDDKRRSFVHENEKSL